MGTVIIVLILLVIVVFAVKSVIHRIRHGYTFVRPAKKSGGFFLNIEFFAILMYNIFKVICV